MDTSQSGDAAAAGTVTAAAATANNGRIEDF